MQNTNNNDVDRSLGRYVGGALSKGLEWSIGNYIGFYFMDLYMKAYGQPQHFLQNYDPFGNPDGVEISLAIGAALGILVTGFSYARDNFHVNITRRHQTD